MKKDQMVLGEKKRSRLKRGVKFDTDFLEIATRLVAAGMKESELAYFLGCTERDIKGLKRKDKMFKKACNEGKELAMSYLIAQALRSAAGYDYEERNIKIKRKFIKVKDEDGNVTEVLKEYPAEESTFVKHQPGNQNLLVFLISNMSRQLGKGEEEKWQSVHKVEVDENKNVSIKISGKVASQQIERLAGAFLEHSKVIEAEVIDARDAQDSGEPRRSTEGDTKKSE